MALAALVLRASPRAAVAYGPRMALTGGARNGRRHHYGALAKALVATHEKVGADSQVRSFATESSGTEPPPESAFLQRIDLSHPNAADRQKLSKLIQEVVKTKANTGGGSRACDSSRKLCCCCCCC